jgi:hypothetical protein
MSRAAVLFAIAGGTCDGAAKSPPPAPAGADFAPGERLSSQRRGAVP